MTQKPENVTSSRGSSPRIGVSLPPEVYALYKAFAQVSGNSMSSMLAEIAVVQAPVLERVLRIAVAAKEADGARREGLQQAASEAEAQLLPLLSQAQLALSDFLDVAESSAARASSRKRGGRGADPRPSNTGVRSTRKPAKKLRRR